jgi:dienelactone hydrolase
MTRLAFVLAVALAGSLGAQDPFVLDTRAPLNVRVIDRMDSAKFTREKIVFDGRPGVRVPGFVAVPKDGAARHPIIVLVDGIGGWKERWWDRSSWNRGKILIDSLVEAGFAVAMAELPASGERTFENDYVSSIAFLGDHDKWRDMAQKNYVEIERFIDYLVARPDLDSSRVGMLGLSHGGMMTFIVAARDSRVKATVTGLAPMQNAPPSLLPILQAPAIRVPMLAMFGTTDSFYTREQVERVMGMLGTKDQKVVWYEGGHRLPETYAGEATRWFARVLRR